MSESFGALILRIHARKHSSTLNYYIFPLHRCSKESESGGTLEHTGAEGSFATGYSIELKDLPASPPESASDKEVHLVNYASGGLKALTLKPHPIFGHRVGEGTHGDLLFESFVKNSASQVFVLSQVSGGDGEFVLRPKATKNHGINVCVLDESLLELTDCLEKEGGSLKSNVKWSVNDQGQIVSFAGKPMISLGGFCINSDSLSSCGVRR